MKKVFAEIGFGNESFLPLIGNVAKALYTSVGVVLIIHYSFFL